MRCTQSGAVTRALTKLTAFLMTSSRSSLSVQLPACVCVRVGWYVCVSVATIVAARGTRMLAFCWRRLDTSTHYNHTFNGSTYAGCNYSGATCGLSMPACGTWGPCLTAAHGTAPTRTTSGCASCRGGCRACSSHPAWRASQPAHLPIHPPRRDCGNSIMNPHPQPGELHANAWPHNGSDAPLASPGSPGRSRFGRCRRLSLLLAARRCLWCRCRS